MSLRARAGCSKRLRWEFDVPPNVDADALASTLMQDGFVAEVPIGALRRYRKNGHQLLVLPARGELRLHYEVPQEERSAFAMRFFIPVYEALFAAVR